MVSWHRFVHRASSLCPLLIALVDDIVRARLRTYGVEEHRFSEDNGNVFFSPS